MSDKILYVILGLILAVSGCEKQKEIQCYPVKIKQTISTGTGASSIISDYKYEGDVLDHINYSDFQSHFYVYSESGALQSVSRKNMQTYEKQESWFTYDGGLAVRSDEYLINFDRITQEDKDTIYEGYREFLYNGESLVMEKLYIPDVGSDNFQLAELREYTYDLKGNIIENVGLSQPSGDTIHAYSYRYDNLNHPFSSLDLIVPGESHINNLLVKKDLLTGDSLTYQNIYTPNSYPSQINIKENAYLSEIFAIEYNCK